MILVFGNCGLKYLLNFLTLSKEFRDKYDMPLIPIKSNDKEKIADYIKIKGSYIIIPNFMVIEKKENLDKYYNQEYDLVIIQQTPDRHHVYSSKSVISRLKYKDIIILPWVRNDGFHAMPIWPHIGNLSRRIKRVQNKIIDIQNTNEKTISFQKIINLFYNHSLDEVFDMLENLKIDFNLLNRFNNSIEILKEKEQFCNITVSDIILNNKGHLFHGPPHPSGYLYQLIANKIFTLLGITEVISIYDNVTSEEMEVLDRKYNLIPDYDQFPLSPYEINTFNLNCKPSKKWLEYYKNKISEIYNRFQELK